MSLILALALSLGALLVFEGLTARVASPIVWPRFIRDPQRRRSVLFGVVLGGAAGVIAVGITASPFLGITTGSVLGYLPSARERTVRRAGLRRTRAQWPDAIAGLVASIRSGMSLPEACEELATRSGPSLRPGFDTFLATYRATGSFEAGVWALRERLEDPIADRVGVALVTAHQVGGTDLVAVLGTLGDLVRDDLRVRGEIEARWSWTITAARLAAAAPWVVLVLMSMQPEGARAYRTSTGALIVMIGGAATLLGYRLMLRATRLPEDRRLS